MKIKNLRFKKAITLVAACVCIANASMAQSTDKHVILLDALDLNKMTQGSSRPQITGEHANLAIHKHKFMNGVHTRSESLLYLELDGKTSEFSAEVGVDDRGTPFRPMDTVKKEDSFADFFVIGDGKVLWKSGTMKYGDDPKHAKVDISGVKELLLKVTGGPGHTHADWTDARFTYSGESPKTVWSPEDKAIIKQDIDFVKQQNVKYPQPRINGAMRVGIRPNTPLYYPMAVTGMRPMAFGAQGIPAGLTLDAKTGIISGTPSAAGEYDVKLSASNSYGKAERTLKIVVGDKLALTPPMGYQSWNVVEGLISETFLKELSDAFVDLGLRDVGFQYINMDDCWQGGRDKNGKIYPDGYRFPNGMKVVGDYLHTKGMKFGVYSTPGPITCAGYAGTMNFEQQDVDSWTSWGFDYLKYDGCTVPGDRSANLYANMGKLLVNSGRSIVYCGRKAAGSQLWRIGGDLRDQWSIDTRDVGVIQSFEKAQVNASTQSPGAWVDPDMLVIGIYGKGSSGNDKTNEKGCTDVEYQSQMSLWCLMSSPLFITVDVRHINPAALAILTNPEVTDVNQDPLGNFPVRIGAAGEQEIWVKKMEDGSKTVAFFNKASASKQMTLKLIDIGLSGTHKVRDLWLRKDIGNVTETCGGNVVSHGVTLLRIY